MSVWCLFDFCLDKVHTRAYTNAHAFLRNKAASRVRWAHFTLPQHTLQVKPMALLWTEIEHTRERTSAESCWRSVHKTCPLHGHGHACAYHCPALLLQLFEHSGTCERPPCRPQHPASTMSMYACMYVCMYVCMYIHACMHVRTYVCMYVCMCMYVFMYVCMYNYMYVCIYLCVYACIY